MDREVGWISAAHLKKLKPEDSVVEYMDVALNFISARSAGVCP